MVEVLLDYLRIWDMVDEFVLHPETPDRYNWKLTQDVPTVVNLPMRRSLWDPSSLVHGEEYGKPGLPLDVNSFSGWCSTKGFGQLTGWQSGICPILSLAPYVVKRMKR